MSAIYGMPQSLSMAHVANMIPKAQTAEDALQWHAAVTLSTCFCCSLKCQKIVPPARPCEVTCAAYMARILEPSQTNEHSCHTPSNTCKMDLQLLITFLQSFHQSVKQAGAPFVFTLIHQCCPEPIMHPSHALWVTHADLAT